MVIGTDRVSITGCKRGKECLSNKERNMKRSAGGGKRRKE